MLFVRMLCQENQLLEEVHHSHPSFHIYLVWKCCAIHSGVCLVLGIKNGVIFLS
jgi:hypothetical protein